MKRSISLQRAASHYVTENRTEGATAVKSRRGRDEGAGRLQTEAARSRPVLPS